MLLTKTEGLKYNDIVLLKCEYNQEGCLGIYEKEYRQYKHGLKRSIIKKDCCNNPKCMHEKRKESLLFTYGVDNIAHIEGVKEKRESTCIEKYGSKTPLSNKDIIDKGKITVLEKYGVENISKAEEIKNKKRESCIKNFGVENATQSEEVKAKMQKTIIEKYGVKSYTQTEEYKNKVNKSNLKKYGVKWAGQSKQVIEKRMRTLRKNGNAPKSIQQKYLCTLLNGVLNYQINNCFVDILLEDNIVLEYDGGGHTMTVKCGNLTEKEFKRLELKRETFIRSKGYKIIRIITGRDLLPQDEKILHMVQEAILYLSSGHSWIYFDINNSKIINSTGEYDYDFGQLRRLYKKNL